MGPIIALGTGCPAEPSVCRLPGGSTGCGAHCPASSTPAGLSGAQAAHRRICDSHDEVGYLPLDDAGATILFQLVSARYERGSIILTSNKSYGDWGTVFGDPIIATAPSPVGC